MSITIVVYNSATKLAACLDSIRGDLADGFAELIVVDNASPDDSMTIVAERCPAAVRIDAGANRGFAGGCNLAWPAAGGRFWLLLNPDVILPPGGLRALAAWLDAHPESGAVSPSFVDGEGRRCGCAQRFPSLALSLLEMTRLHRVLPRPLRGRLLRGAYWSGGDQLDVDWIPATALLVRREAVAAAGLLSEAFFMYGEDIEWCWRLHRAGWAIGVRDDVVARHHEASSSERTWGTDGAARRIAAGIVRACRAIHGGAYARAWAALQAIALSLEAALPGRSPKQRSRARAFAAGFALMVLGDPPALGAPTTRIECSTRA